MPPFIVCIDGLIGAGKSSLFQRLAPDYACFPEPLAEWNLLPSLYEAPDLYALPFQLQVLVSQFKQRQQFPCEGVVLVERCPWTSRHVFAPLLLGESDLALLDPLYRRLSYDVDYHLYLHVEPGEAHQRLRHRSPMDRDIPLDYLQRLHDRYASALCHSADWVDANRPLDAVERDVRALLAKRTASSSPVG